MPRFSSSIIDPQLEAWFKNVLIDLRFSSQLFAPLTPELLHQPYQTQPYSRLYFIIFWLVKHNSSALIDASIQLIQQAIMAKPSSLIEAIPAHQIEEDTWENTSILFWLLSDEAGKKIIAQCQLLPLIQQLILQNPTLMQAEVIKNSEPYGSWWCHAANADLPTLKNPTISTLLLAQIKANPELLFRHHSHHPHLTFLMELAYSFPRHPVLLNLSEYGQSLLDYELSQYTVLSHLLFSMYLYNQAHFEHCCALLNTNLSSMDKLTIEQFTYILTALNGRHEQMAALHSILSEFKPMSPQLQILCDSLGVRCQQSYTSALTTRLNHEQIAAVHKRPAELTRQEMTLLRTNAHLKADCIAIREFFAFSPEFFDTLSLLEEKFNIFLAQHPECQLPENMILPPPTGFWQNTEMPLLTLPDFGVVSKSQVESILAVSQHHALRRFLLDIVQTSGIVAARKPAYLGSYVKPELLSKTLSDRKIFFDIGGIGFLLHNKHTHLLQLALISLAHAQGKLRLTTALPNLLPELMKHDVRASNDVIPAWDYALDTIDPNIPTGPYVLNSALQVSAEIQKTCPQFTAAWRFSFLKAFIKCAAHDGFNYTPRISSFAETHDPNADAVYMGVNEKAERGVQQNPKLERRGVYNLSAAAQFAVLQGITFYTSEASEDYMKDWKTKYNATEEPPKSGIFYKNAHAFKKDTRPTAETLAAANSSLV